MSSLSERSVMHIFGVTGMVIMTLMPMIATESSSPSSPLSSSSPASDLLFHPVESKKHQGSGDKEIREISYLQQDHRQKVIIEEDYGVWNPTPRPGDGGGRASPVPHAKDSRHFSSKIISGLITHLPARRRRRRPNHAGRFH
ncbi:uncharacterized protein LOC110417224 [Herrania umbratica]|uniref:Uncharacterized protein LOC110417224 n=1 Tax=Herrania umbratica TaxID=108875 RepID=A0A6J1AD68_9ROSI|nr:uncharacterized protein LOC110417224 [Herrania umbratica]